MNMHMASFHNRKLLL